MKLWGGSKKKNYCLGHPKCTKAAQKKVQKPLIFKVLGTRNAQKNARKVVKTIQILAFFTICEIP